MAKLEKHPSGPMTKKTTENIEEIISRITNGESVAKILQDKHLPSRMVFFKWVAEDQELSNRYTRALQDRTHLKAEERHDIIQDAIDNLGCLPEGVNGNVYAQLIKEKIRAVEWDAERLAPVKYKPKPEDYDKGEAQPLSINFTVSDPVGEIKTTNAKP